MKHPTYADALAEWVLRRDAQNEWRMRERLVEVEDVAITNMTEGGHCANGTCWFEGTIMLCFLARDEDGNVDRIEDTYDLTPGEFVEQTARIWDELKTAATNA